MRITASRKDILVCAIVLGVVGVVCLYALLLLNEDHTKTKAYAELLALYDRLYVGMEFSDVYPLIKQGEAHLKLIGMDSRIVPIPKKGLEEVGIHSDTRLLVIYTPISIAARNRIMGIQFEDEKVTAVMIRIADTSHFRPKDAPKDKIAPDTVINKQWVLRGNR